MTRLLDAQLFINEVKIYPELWDLNNEDYRNKIKKQLAWAEIAGVVIENFEQTSNTEKLEIYRTLCSKWRNLRDSYVRHVKKKYGKSGYKNAKYLSFLSNIYQKSPSGSEADADETWQSDTEDSKSKLNTTNEIKSELSWTSDVEDDEPLMESQKRKRPKKEFEYIEMLPEAVASFNTADEDRLFFESLLPAVRTLDIDHKLEFRSQVIRLVKNIRASARQAKIDTNNIYEDQILKNNIIKNETNNSASISLP